MNLLKSIAISLSLYSKIPMPVFKWEEDNYRHAIAFLPLVGFIIVALSMGVLKLSFCFELPVFVTTLLLVLVPLFVTGGFHVDGFMDVSDALHSYQDRERKLEIMKDPHIGAFAVISIGMLAITWIAALYMIVYRAFETQNTAALMAYTGVFALVRALCGISSIVLKNAKKDGMLIMETGKAGTLDMVILSVFALLALGFMVVMKALAGVILLVTSIIFTIWYKKMCDKNFGGVTGDTAGFYVVLGECILVLALSFFSIICI